MKKLLYVLCCLLSLYVTIDLGYDIIRQLSEQPAVSYRLFIRLLAAAGWGIITYQIIAQKYKWVQKLCK